jgi:8-amino-7-oxononanoate synthase
MASASDHYETILSELRSRTLLRELKTVENVSGTDLVVDGRRLVNFASNDYLGLSQLPSLKAVACAAIEEFGIGAGASRLITGSRTPHKDLERDLAAFKGTESALLLGSGYAAALGALGSLAGTGDVILLDKLVHACIIDGAKLSGATIRVFPHNNIERLKRLLRWAREKHPANRVIIATESVFSMDGDLADLAEIVRLKKEFGAFLFVDEAHAVGVIGPGGRGLMHALGLGGEAEIQMGTLSKAIGVSGGFLCGSAGLIELLVNRARSFIYSTAPPPALAAAAGASLALLQSDEGEQLRNRLWRNIRLLASHLRNEIMRGREARSAIFPILAGTEERAVELANLLLKKGFFIPAIRYPTVARGEARIRIALSAAHVPEQIEGLALAINEWHEKA